MKNPKFRDLYNEKLLKVKQLILEKKHDESLKLIGDSKDEILSMYKA